jgi:N utilization substance protein A
MRVFRARHIVAEVEDPTTQWTIDDAKPYKPDVRLGDLVEYEQLDGETFGRIGAQTAKQVVLQRLREAEREVVFGQYADRESEIITGVVSRVEPRGVILDVGRAEAILATTDQSATESYRIGQHVKAYVLEVRRTTKGPLIYISRTHKNFLRRLFELEVPEIHAGTVEIKAIAREAGSRSKVAVSSRQEGLDPVGATVGQRGGRVQSVVAELNGEKIDVIPWAEDPAVFVANALSPAQVVSVSIDTDARIASVTVPERMLSLAIGREGQNARLAAKLTGWRIDIRSDQAPVREAPAPAPTAADDAAAASADAVTADAAPEAAEAETPSAAEPVAATDEVAPASAAAAKKPRATRKTAAKPKAAAGEPSDAAPAAEAKAPEEGIEAADASADAPAEGAPDIPAETEPAAKPRSRRKTAQEVTT